MNEDIGWKHPIDDSDEWDGFNHPGIETFAGNPLFSIGKEICQNSVDAAEDGTVVVKFKLREVKTNSIPDYEDLKVIISACRVASEHEGKKAKAFLETALAELSKRKVKVLEISDYNTKGMKGPSKNGTPFYAFVKAKGQSQKDSETAGGSYGIGQFAPYTVSKLRTILVSTVFKDESGVHQQYTQGKSILMSHDEGETRKRGVGFWGAMDKCQPLIGISESLEPWIQRANNEENLAKGTGTKISILCFDDKKHWQESLAVSIAVNFFGAIYNKKLKVNIDSKHILDHTTIQDFFNKKELINLIEEDKLENRDNALDQLKNSSNYLETLQHKPSVIVEESQMIELGKCEIRILLGDDIPKKVCILRNGMFITDRLNGLKEFHDFKGFVATFECKNNTGNELLRRMEPPKHDAFEPERLDIKNIKKGKDSILKIKKWVRDMLKRHAKDPVSEVTGLDELKHLFGEEGEGGAGIGTEEINPYGKVVIRGKPIKKNPLSAKKQADEENGAGEQGESGSTGGREEGGTSGNADGGSGGGDRSSSGEGNRGRTGKSNSSSSTKNPLDIRNVRSIISGTKQRKVAFTLSKLGNISVRLMAAGADSDYDLVVVSSNIGTINEGIIELEVTEESRVSLDVELDQNFSGAIKVIAYEI